MDLRARLEQQFCERRRRNSRYSLRGFARSLGMHHSVLSQILQRRRRLTARTIQRIGTRIGLTAHEIRDCCLAEHCDAILAMLGDPRFRADARWLAMMAGITLIDVQAALHWLLYTGRLSMRSPSTWTTETLHGQPGRTLADHLA
ncbi:MAG TPA: hypothetical protein VH277_10645 [Gemmatimonadaceae bacterium]|jgi:hypothetical protein|nr:hypothetical protein [Gemmatimonadaceae bacterium]